MDKYKLVRLDNSDNNFTGNPRIIGYGTRKEVRANLKMLRKDNLFQFRYIMLKDKRKT